MLSNQLTQPLRLKLAAGSWQILSAKAKKPLIALKNQANLVGHSIIQSLWDVLSIIQPRARETATLRLVITTYLSYCPSPQHK